MPRKAELVSPKQVARALGVSESSLKRWCDRGLVRAVRTAGGHRKLEVGEVLLFARERGLNLAAPELLGLPSPSKHADSGLTRGGSLLATALLEGNEPLARQIVFDLHLAGHSLSVMFDDVFAAAFHEIGDRWACRQADTYQERRGLEIAARILFELRRLIPTPEKRWLATGGTLTGDLYSLPSTMAELVLLNCGFFATPLGTSLPVESLIKAIRETRPHLFWLSVSYIPENPDFHSQFAGLSDCCDQCGTALVVGGRALTAGVRQKISYSAYCDTMQHFENFGRTLIRSLEMGSAHQDATGTRARRRRARSPSNKRPATGST
jgi:methanogenic corrinoid protein MtbC1